jgi:RNA polymerase sigma-70 factor (ECF subfamily)
MPPFVLAALSDLRAASEIGEEDEAALIAKAQKGDADAFDSIVARYEAKVYGLCLWTLGNPDDAADAAQDAFVRAWRSLDKFRGDAKLGTWLHRIAVNVCYDALKKRGKTPLPASQLAPTWDDEDAPALEVPDAPECDPAARAARRERQKVVREAMLSLSPDHRAIVILFDIEGRTYEEASAILGVPMGTIKSRLNRARDSLRRALEPFKELWDA